MKTLFTLFPIALVISFSAHGKGKHCLNQDAPLVEISSANSRCPLSCAPTTIAKADQLAFGEPVGRSRCRASAAMHAKIGQDARAISSGVVVDKGAWTGTTGYVTVKHDNGLLVRYAPVSHGVKLKQPIRIGDKLGRWQPMHFLWAQRYAEKGVTPTYVEFYDHDKFANSLPQPDKENIRRKTYRLVNNRSNRPFFRNEALLNPTSFLDALCAEVPSCDQPTEKTPESSPEVSVN